MVFRNIAVPEIYNPNTQGCEDAGKGMTLFRTPDAWGGGGVWLEDIWYPSTYELPVLHDLFDPDYSEHLQEYMAMIPYLLVNSHGIILAGVPLDYKFMQGQSYLTTTWYDMVERYFTVHDT
jgi:hypothetical protein